MPRYRLTRDYANDRFFGREGDVVEMNVAEYDRLCNDSPGTFEEVDTGEGEVELAGLTAADVLDEHGAQVLAELQAQTPTLDIDPEDKAKEVPGEGNKYTPASGYNPAPASAVRVVERAPADRQKKASGKRGEADAGATSADTSASARVTAEPTPASKAADKAQLAGGVTSKTEEDEEEAEKRRLEQEEADKAAREVAAARAPRRG